MELNEIKNRFGIIGNDPRLNNAIDTAVQIAGTNLSVLITGESGVGKEVIPKIIHAFSPRKHNNYIAINCGAIPEGTIESELFGHEKGSFTGANEARKGYFEAADKGTIFLDINFMHAVREGKFREDLYYRLNAVPIYIPPLRERKGDIHLLFMKFALDFADKYKMPAVRLEPDARTLLEAYRWPGNIRQLKNVAEQISVLESNRQISAEVLGKYLPADDPNSLPVRNCDSGTAGNIQDRDIIFKMLFQLREEVDELRAIIGKPDSNVPEIPQVHALPVKLSDMPDFSIVVPSADVDPVKEETPLTIHDMNDDMIRRALEKHEGRRKAAAAELGISERTLYRKIKELKINDNDKHDEKD